MSKVLIVVAVVLAARVVLRYFGVLAGHSVGAWMIAVSGMLVVPFGWPTAHSLYGGVFDTDAAVTLAIALLVEWAFELARGED